MTFTIVIVGVILIAGTIYQSYATRRDRRIFATGRFVTLDDGTRLHVNCTGSASPIVILESGIAASSVSWALVQPQVAAFARVCSYDRAGLGWSDPDPRPISVDAHAATLRQLLSALDLEPPYILVGHSYGSFVVRAFAHRYRSLVAGIVLVDPIFSSEWSNPEGDVRRRLRGGIFLSHVGAMLARVGFVRLCLAMLTGRAPRAARGVSHAFGAEAASALSRLVGEVRKLPMQVWPSVRALWAQPKCFTAMARHLAALPASARAVAPCTDVGDVPVVVITSGKQSEAAHREQQRLAATSTRGRQIIAAGSGHWVHLDEPELIVDVIKDMVRR